MLDLFISGLHFSFQEEYATDTGCDKPRRERQGTQKSRSRRRVAENRESVEVEKSHLPLRKSCAGPPSPGEARR